MLKVFFRGLRTGLILQIAIGPVFFFLVNIALQKTLMDGLVGVLAVTIVDYLYIGLAIGGVGKLLEREKLKKTLGIMSSIILICFGIYIGRGALNTISVSTAITDSSSSLFNSFISAFLLTVSSPLTILFWTSIFAARSIEYSLSKKELLLFGIAAGLATLIFLSTSISITTLFKATISLVFIKYTNILVSLLLVGYGVKRMRSESLKSKSIK